MRFWPAMTAAAHVLVHAWRHSIEELRKDPMKNLALALVIPVAICSASGIYGTAFAAQPPAPAGAPANANAAPAPRTTAQVSLTSAAGSAVKGNLTLTSEGVAVSIRGEITGLSPGKEHGFHVHENGQCELPDFTSAGGHFNPTRDSHGGPESTPRHLGDIPNAKADQNGRATIDVSVKGATLVDKDGGPNELLGKTLVVHAMPDDYKSQPAGNSGARIACGVIR
jgi:Cu-Zn family superoxide dismutase